MIQNQQTSEIVCYLLQGPGTDRGKFFYCARDLETWLSTEHPDKDEFKEMEKKFLEELEKLQGEDQ